MGLDWRRDTKLLWAEQGQYSTQLMTREAERIVREHDPSRPLFMYLAYQGRNQSLGTCPVLRRFSTPTAVHNPWSAPEEYIRQYPYITNTTRRVYAGVVSCMDDGIRNVTTAFQAAGLWEDTVVIWTSGTQALLRGLPNSNKR